MENVFVMDSPIGSLCIKANSEAIISISRDESARCTEKTTSENALIDECVKQLKEYFEGTRTDFQLPLLPQGTPYRLGVWEELCKIPYGTTTTYKSLAERLYDARHSRSVAQALHDNPLLIVIPCHRVVGSDGSLTGFAAGLEAKSWLLNHENKKRGLM